jgi:hypothetical protein
VPQDEVKPLVVNTFEDFDTVRKRAASAPAAKGRSAAK